jgi:hypothetical protein
MDLRAPSSPGNVRRNSAACLAQMGTHRRLFTEYTLATARFPHRRIREPTGPIAFPHFRIGLRGDLFLATWKFPLTLKREDEFLL